VTQYYVGTKIVLAYPQEKDGQPGYGITYQDGYTSWSPKEVFEKAYYPMGPSNNNRVTQEMVDDFIDRLEVSRVGEKNTVVRGICRNGFELVESSSCVDPANYDEEIGKKICLERIKNKIWHLLGFLVQTGFKGISPAAPAAAEVNPVPEPVPAADPAAQ
jgi:hypothetical protein